MTGSFILIVAIGLLGMLAPLPVVEIAGFLVTGAELLITADHGNAEQMRNGDTGQVHTAHTTNPVPLLGGAAIYLAFMLSWLFLGGRDDQNLVLVACAGAMFLVGLVDDIFELADPSYLVYDSTRGLQTDDSGWGPPLSADNPPLTRYGWVRTGAVSPRDSSQTLKSRFIPYQSTLLPPAMSRLLSPIRVFSPSPVAAWTVQNSRKSLLSPMST